MPKTKRRTGSRPANRSRAAAPARRPAPQVAARHARSVGPRLPRWARRPDVVLAAALSLFWFLLLVAGALSTVGLFLFLTACSIAAVHLVTVLIELYDGDEVLRSLRRITATVVVVALPVVFDPGTAERYNLAKLFVLAVGAATVGALWALESFAARRAAPAGAPGLWWPIVAVVGVTAWAAVFAVNHRVAVLGDYASYDGLITALSLAALAALGARAWRAADVGRVLRAFALCAGGPVIVYGLVQVADVELSTNWDWVAKANVQASFGLTTSVWSTFGNPDHLASFVAILLPVCLFAMLTARSTVARVVAAAVAGGAVLCLVETSSLGGAFGSACGLVILGALLVPELRARPRLGLGLGAALVVAVLGGVVVLGAQGNLSAKIRGATKLSGTSSTAQRIDYWHRAVEMATDRPLFGVGPDGYGGESRRYQDAHWVKTFGPDLVVNGAHNSFFNSLADHGVLGPFALGWLYVAAALVAVRAWRRLRALERSGAPPDAADARLQRLALAGVAGALTGYAGGAFFDVAQLGLLAPAWGALGLLGVAAIPAAVEPPAARPRVVARRASTAGVEPRVAVLALVLASAVLLVSVAMGAVWFADRAYASALEGTARVAARFDKVSSIDLVAVRKLEADFKTARRWNGWEPLYAGQDARFQVNQLTIKQPRDTTALQAAVAVIDGLYRKAADAAPRNPDWLSLHAITFHQLTSGSSSAAAEELGLWRRAVAANPFRMDYALRMAAMQRTLGDVPGAQATEANALKRAGRDPRLLTEGLSDARSQQLTESAHAFHQALAEVDPTSALLQTADP